MKRIHTLLLFLLFHVSASARIWIDSYGDTLKGDIKSVVQYSVFRRDATVLGDWKPDTIKSVYTYDKVTRVELIIFYNERGKGMGRQVIRFDEGGRIIDDNTYTDIDSLYRKRSFTYDAKGRLVEKTDMDYPFLASYPAEEKEVWTYFKDSLGSRVAYAYDGGGRVKDETEFEILDERTTTVRLAAYTYDKAGRKAEEYGMNLRACGQEDRYVLFYMGGRGYATKTVFKYDSIGRLVEQTEYSERKGPDPFMTGNERTGIHIAERKLYRYHGLNESMVELNLASLYRQADGSITAGQPWIYPDWAGKPYDHREYDQHGNVTRKTNGNELVFERVIEYF